MAALVLPVVRSSLPLLTSALLLFAGCDRENIGEKRQMDGLKEDLDESKRRLSHIQNSLAAKDAELVVSVSELEKAKGTIAGLEKAVKERDTQVAATKSELDDLKKRDGLVFADIAASQQQGANYVALSRYQKFVVDYPRSALVPHANAAIAQLNEGQREVRRQIQQVLPEAREKEIQKNFNDGYMTLQELSPIVKKKKLTEILSLFGRPNQTFNENTEIGYADKAINPATGTRGMLIIGFESGVVSTIRVEYSGRKVTP